MPAMLDGRLCRISSIGLSAIFHRLPVWSACGGSLLLPRDSACSQREQRVGFHRHYVCVLPIYFGDSPSDQGETCASLCSVFRGLHFIREINHGSKAAWACFKRYATELFDRPGVPFRLKTRLLKAEAVEVLLYGCMTWSPRRDHYRLLQTTHHRLPLRVIGYRRKRGSHRQMS